MLGKPTYQWKTVADRFLYTEKEIVLRRSLANILRDCIMILRETIRHYYY
jgi:hypothetical protein